MYAELLEKYLDRDAPHGELLTVTQLRHLRSFSEWLESNAAIGTMNKDETVNELKKLFGHPATDQYDRGWNNGIRAAIKALEKCIM